MVIGRGDEIVAEDHVVFKLPNQFKVCLIRDTQNILMLNCFNLIHATSLLYFNDALV